MQNTKEELYLAAILGEYSGELPLPNTKVECYLYKLATDGVPGGSGGGTVDLSGYATKEEVAQLESNVSQLNRKTIKFRHGKGMFNATATGTNIVWKYGSQEIQGESCTFDVKSDNGLIVIEFDKMTKITISNDSLNKLCLSDLCGNITNNLNLIGCSQITGDLSDLCGNITNYLSLYGCSKITGDLSDLGGKITNTLNLYNCSNIIGIYNVVSAFPKTIDLSKTAITTSDMDQNLINAANSDVKNGNFTATNMTRTAESDDAITTLVSNGWTVSGLTKVEV